MSHTTCVECDYLGQWEWKASGYVDEDGFLGISYAFGSFLIYVIKKHPAENRLLAV